MDTRALELLNLELDGQLDAAGRAELDKLLAADPALRAQQAQLRAVARWLAQSPAPELPADFHDSVMRHAQLPLRRQRPRRYWRAGLALAASVLVAVVVLRIVGDGSFGPVGQLAATLAPASASATAVARGGGLDLSFQLPAGPADLVLEFEPGHGDGILTVTADGRLRPRIDGRRIVIPSVPGGRVEFRVSGDVATFTAAFDRDGDVIPVTVHGP